MQYKMVKFEELKFLKMNQDKFTYDTLSQALNDLIKRGYTTDFLMEAEKDCLICKSQEGEARELSPEEFQIDEVYWYVGLTGPYDDSILFAISSSIHNIKGTVVNSYGADFGYRSSKLVEHLNRHLNK